MLNCADIKPHKLEIPVYVHQVPTFVTTITVLYAMNPSPLPTRIMEKKIGNSLLNCLLRWPLRNSASVLHLILEHGASQPFSSFLAEVLFSPLRALLLIWQVWLLHGP